jgi:hypothetical protein
MFQITYTLADGSKIFDSVAGLANALFCAFEYPPENAVRSEVRGYDGYYRSYRLKGL